MTTDWIDPRWFAEDFLNLYEQVVGTDPDIRESYWKWAHNARIWLRDHPPAATDYTGKHRATCDQLQRTPHSSGGVS